MILQLCLVSINIVVYSAELLRSFDFNSCDSLDGWSKTGSGSVSLVCLFLGCSNCQMAMSSQGGAIGYIVDILADTDGAASIDISVPTDQYQSTYIELSISSFGILEACGVAYRLPSSSSWTAVNLAGSTIVSNTPNESFILQLRSKALAISPCVFDDIRIYGETAAPPRAPTLRPTSKPSLSPTPAPTMHPPFLPTKVPSRQPTAAPTQTAAPTFSPSKAPTAPSQMSTPLPLLIAHVSPPNTVAPESDDDPENEMEVNEDDDTVDSDNDEVTVATGSDESFDWFALKPIYIVAAALIICACCSGLAVFIWVKVRRKHNTMPDKLPVADDEDAEDDVAEVGILAKPALPGVPTKGNDTDYHKSGNLGFLSSIPSNMPMAKKHVKVIAIGEAGDPDPEIELADRATLMQVPVDRKSDASSLHDDDFPSMGNTAAMGIDEINDETLNYDGGESAGHTRTAEHGLLDDEFVIHGDSDDDSCGKKNTLGKDGDDRYDDVSNHGTHRPQSITLTQTATAQHALAAATDGVNDDY